MRTIILYRSSYKGNTLKIAQSMADALSAELVSVDNTPTIDLSGYDLIDCGYDYGNGHIVVVTYIQTFV